MKVETCMSTPAYCLQGADPVAHAQREMLGRGVSQLPVVDDKGRLLGILGLREAKTASPGARVATVMKPPLATVTRSMTISTAARHLYERAAHAAPVLERGRVVGLVTLDDLTRALRDAGADIVPSWHRAVAERGRVGRTE